MSIKIKTQNGIIDTDKEPVVFVFDNNDDKNMLLDMLAQIMDDKNTYNQRKIFVGPDTMTDEEVDDFIEYGREIK